MKVIIKPRGSGKTTELIKMSEPGKYIICYSREEAARVAYMAQEMGVDIPFPISYEEFIEERYYHRYHLEGGIKSFFIDNLDVFLQVLTTVPIEAITLTDYET